MTDSEFLDSLDKRAAANAAVHVSDLEFRRLFGLCRAIAFPLGIAASWYDPRMVHVAVATARKTMTEDVKRRLAGKK